MDEVEAKSVDLPPIAEHSEAAPIPRAPEPTGLDTATIPLLGDHRVLETAILPAAACLEMALSAAGRVTGRSRHQLVDVSILRPLVVPDAAARAVQLVLDPTGSDALAFRLFSGSVGTSGSTDDWTLHATGTVTAAGAGAAASAEPLAEGPLRVRVVL